ncbi:hypothetical protein Phage2-1_00072 [Achromobacter phage 2-1]|nr:hypothetical protein Phage2-1_00072 [Achromobacter phage 2-1]
MSSIMMPGEFVQAKEFKLNKFSSGVNVTAGLRIPEAALKKDDTTRMNFLYVGVSNKTKTPSIDAAMATVGYYKKPSYTTLHDVPQEAVEALQELPVVEEALLGFSADPTGPNGFEIVRAVMFALANTK